MTFAGGLISESFREAVLAVGLYDESLRSSPETGESQVFKETRHTFHDLRHTFALFAYKTFRAEGISEPWKEVQRLLRHRHMSTTVDTYLKVIVEEYDTSVIDDTITNAYRGLI